MFAAVLSAFASAIESWVVPSSFVADIVERFMKITLGAAKVMAFAGDNLCSKDVEAKTTLRNVKAYMVS